jgi:hypothetical protein
VDNAADMKGTKAPTYSMGVRSGPLSPTNTSSLIGNPHQVSGPAAPLVPPHRLTHSPTKDAPRCSVVGRGPPDPGLLLLAGRALGGRLLSRLLGRLLSRLLSRLPHSNGGRLVSQLLSRLMSRLPPVKGGRLLSRLPPPLHGVEVDLRPRHSTNNKLAFVPINGCGDNILPTRLASSDRDESSLI